MSISQVCLLYPAHNSFLLHGNLETGCQEAIHGLRSQLATLMQMRVQYGEMYCEKHGIGPTGGFCVKTTETDVGGNTLWDKFACTRMADILAGSRVLDLGCGLGRYGACLDQAGKDIAWTGYDGSEGIERATGENNDGLG